MEGLILNTIFMGNAFINSAYADPPPNEWEESKKECKVKGKIVYFTFEPSSPCVNYYHIIVRDEKYNYYKITSVENKPFYRDLSGTHAKEISCSGAYIDLGNSLVPKIGENYHFIIRKYYDTDNYIKSYTKESYSDWEKQPDCDWNIIDRVPGSLIKTGNPYFGNTLSGSLQIQNSKIKNECTIYYLGGVIILLLIMVAVGVKKLYFTTKE